MVNPHTPTNTCIEEATCAAHLFSAVGQVMSACERERLETVLEDIKIQACGFWSDLSLENCLDHLPCLYLGKAVTC